MVLVTGGCGYVGSHTVVELLQEGESVLVVDDLSNASKKSLERVRQITGKEVCFEQVDLKDAKALGKVFDKYCGKKAGDKIDTVIHFAAFKAVGESVKKPLEYYQNNTIGVINLLFCMQKHAIKNFVFSSSATVYGVPERCPIEETAGRSALSPYGATKIITEDILLDIAKADKDFSAILLRYFNPVGAHKSGLIGENPKGIPNNLMPYITGAAIGKLPPLKVFGGDYPTMDGTCVRDYIHIVDLAKGHIAALKKVRQQKGAVAYNLGTGKGLTVLQIIQAFEKSTGVSLPYTIVERREGDATECYASTTKAEQELAWKASLGVEDMCKDHYDWQVKNPNGYND
ncbi:MAG: UDP-glucose 4-epimerase GalE [Firmicutes bacterium]|nr:UDP-glucose 4-epimerase GalE [Bacillota bacterium]